MSVDDALDFSVALGRNDGGDAFGVEFGEDGVGVVAFVGENDARGGAGLVFGDMIRIPQTAD